ncbi:MAG TPA: hypothetical protein ENK58_00630 [Desulfobacterales bacterium]|nr:MAG: hypothetical protein DRI57_08300 [Deltaproteobacteria bacterium]HHC23909.1 hypothetical protein [Desulfobacterales bacterium]
MYKIVLTKQAGRDAVKLERHNLKSKAMNLIRMIQTDPFAYPHAFEHLGGKMIPKNQTWTNCSETGKMMMVRLD